MNGRILYSIGAVLAIAVVLWLIFFSSAAAPTVGEVSTTTPAYECNADAKICADGTVVGRTGANCEFSACPPADATSTEVTTFLGGTASGLRVSITPLKVVQDSRCPQGVQCIWAGTVQVNARIVSGMGTSTMQLDLGVPVTTEAEEITLVGVTPAKIAGQEIPGSSYRFTFSIKKR